MRGSFDTANRASSVNAPRRDGVRRRRTLGETARGASLVRSTWRAATLLGLLALTVVTSGCNAGTIGIVIWLLLDDDDSRRRVAATEPAESEVTVFLESVDQNRTRPTEIALDIRLVDLAATTASLRVEYRDASGAYAPASVSPGSGTGSAPGDGVIDGLPTSPGGARHRILWNAVADLGDASFRLVDLRLTADNELETVIPVGNDAPSVRDVSFGTTGDGRIGIGLVLEDSSGDPVDLEVLVSPVTEEPADEDFLPVSTELPTTGLPSSEGGSSTSVVWLASEDLGRIDREVVVRLVPRDLVGADTEGVGSTLDSEVFLDLNAAPVVELFAPASVSERRRGIALGLAIADPESDDVDVIVQWTVDGAEFPELPPEIRSDPQARELLLESEARHDLRIATLLPDVLSGPVEAPGAGVELGEGEILATWLRTGFQLRGLGDLLGRRVRLTRGNETQVRSVCGYSPITGVLRLGEPFEYPPAPGERISIDLGGALRLRSSPEGAAHDVLWATLVDLPGGGPVRIRVTPFDRVVVPEGDELASCRPATEFPLDGAVAGDQGDATETVDEILVAGPFGQRDALVLPLAPVDEPRAVGAADLDADGRTDLVVASRDSRSLVVFFQRVPGAFDQLRLLDARIGEPTGIAIADFDGDGDPDIALSSEEFTTEVEVDDGVVMLERPGSVLLYLQDEGRDFISDRVSLTTGEDFAAPSALVASDLDGDDDVDLAVSGAGPTDAALTLLYRAGGDATAGCEDIAGGYVACTLDHPGGEAGGARDVALADVDADGADDLVTARLGGFGVFFGDGDGTFATRSAEVAIKGSDVLSVVVLDVDGDGAVDLIGADAETGALVVAFGDGAGGFEVGKEPWRPFGLDAAVDLSSSDVDGDGSLDLVIADAGSGVEGTADIVVCLSTASGVSCDAIRRQVDGPYEPRAVAAADLDGDGLSDIVSGEAGASEVAIYLQDMPPAFDEPGEVIGMFAGGSAATSFAPADLDGDGDLDLVVALAGADELALVFQEEGGFVVDDASGILEGLDAASPIEVLVGDVDGDGRADIVVSAIESDTVVVALQGEDGGWTRRVALTSAELSGPEGVAIADLDGDGRLDVAVAGRFSDKVVWFAQTADGGFGDGAVAVTLPAGSGAADLAAEDLNADGLPDLIVPAQRSGAVLVFLHGPERGVFAETVVGALPADAQPTSVSVADLDGDGDLDLALSASGDAGALILAQGPDGSFGDGEAPRGGLESHGTDGAVSDVDRDGRADIVYGSADGSISLLLGTSDGFLAPRVLGVGDIGGGASGFLPVAVAAFDLDGDGAEDLVTLDRHAESLIVFWGGR